MQPAAHVDEPWSEPDAGVCPVIAAFLGAWNGDLPQEEREVLLTPLIPVVAGSRNRALEGWRGLMVGDWLVRTQAVGWLRLARVGAAADALQDSSKLTDAAGAATLLTALKAALWTAVDVRDAVWSTPAGAATPQERAAHFGKSWEAPWAIAAEAWANVGIEEARAATAAAGLEAARPTIWVVEDLRAHAEVWNLAHATARTAAHAGFCLGGLDALQVTCRALQTSAAELVIGMVEAR